MRLWNEYEGTTIASSFPIEKLIRPEGRSAFFSTFNGSGQPAIIRLIESHFDEAEILARWQLVASLDQPHLLKLKKFGRTELDGTPLLYVVMETSDASLSDVLRDRVLTVEETRQVATSLVPALQALHSANLLHEHIEPANVLATGEVVKLRSDCIREVPEGTEGVELKARDVQAFATLLLECLTRQSTLEAGGNTTLPAPFNQIIRNTLNGVWGLQQVADALALPCQGPVVTKPAATPKTTETTPKTKETPVTLPQPSDEPLLRHSSSAPASSSANHGRIHLPVRNARPSFLVTLRQRPLWLAAGAAALLLILFALWRQFHATPQPPVTTLAESGRQAATPAGPTAAAPTTAPSPVVEQPSGPSAAAWRVVAFTYNHRAQAQQKANDLARRHPDLHPEVFTPTGHAPFLVTVGGPMSRDQAESFKRRARSMGLPRDTYAQNYSGSSR